MAVTVTHGGAVRVVVYDSRIQAMSLPGGDVYRYASEKARKTSAYAQEFAPVRTGRLRSSIRHDTRTIVQGAVGRARANVYYAAWVHEGTDPVSAHMWMPKWKGSTYRVWRDYREGQSANPFLERALNAAMRDPFAGARLRGNPFG